MTKQQTKQKFFCVVKYKPTGDCRILEIEQYNKTAVRRDISLNDMVLIGKISTEKEWQKRMEQ